MAVTGPIQPTGSGTPATKGGWGGGGYEQYNNGVETPVDGNYIYATADDRWHYALFSIVLAAGHTADKITIAIRNWVNQVSAEPGAHLSLYTDHPTEKARQIGSTKTIKFPGTGGAGVNGQLVFNDTVTKEECAALRLEWDSFPAAGPEPELDIYDPPNE
jgi:hypothetical protein